MPRSFFCYSLNPGAMMLSRVRPKLFWFAVITGYVASALLLYGPALGNSRFVFGTDTYSHDYIMHLYGWGEIKGGGRWPLWCPYLFSGLPFIASFALCPFYPSQWLYFALAFNTAFTLQYALAVAAGACGFAAWMRAERLSRGAAAIAGAIYLVSGHVLTLTYAGHLQKMQALAWAPFALAGAAILIRQRLLPGILLTGLALGMQLLASHAQVFYGTVATIVLYVVGAIVWRKTFSLPLKKRALIGFIATTAAVVIGVSFSAIQMLPGFEMSRLSNRANGVSFDEATATSYPPLEVTEYLVPRALGDSLPTARVPYTGKWGERIVSDYLGAPVFIIAAVGLLISRRRLRFFLGVITVASLAVSFGHFTPFYRLLYLLAPGFKQFRSPGTFMFIANLGIVGLCALGLEEILRSRKFRVPPRLAFRVSVTTGALLFLAIAAAAIASLQNAGVKLDIATAVELRRWNLWRGIGILGLEAAIGAAALLLIARTQNFRLRTAAITVLCVAAIAFPTFHNRYFLKFSDLQPYMEYLHFQPVYAALESAPERPLRVLEMRALKSDPILHRVTTITGYHPVILGRYERLMSELGFSSDTFGRIYGVTYSHSYDITQPPGEWTAFRKMGSETVWRRKAGMPPYVRGGIRLVEVPNDSEAGAHLREFGVDESAAVTAGLLDDLGVEPGRQPVTAELLSWRPDEIRLNVIAQRRAILPISETFAPGWKATSDKNQPLAQLPVNIAQRAIVVPPGRHQVRLTYEPFSFRLGAFATLLTIAMALFAVLRTFKIPQRVKEGVIER